MTNAVLLLGTTSESNVTGSNVNVATLKRDKDAKYTATINVENFAGRIYLQGSLVKTPGASDWFNIKIGDKRYIDYPINPASPRGTGGDTAIDKFNFAGNYLHIRAVVDKTAVAVPNGKILQILLADEYSAELHNDYDSSGPTTVIDPGSGSVIGTGTKTVDYATVTVDSLGKIVSIKSNDPTKISAQTYIVNTYAELAALTTVQAGDTAYVTSQVDPKRGLYINTGTAWHGFTDDDFSINRQVAAGTYSNATVQVDQYGRVLFAQSGTDVNSLRRVVEFDTSAAEFSVASALPANCNVKKIVVEVDEPFDVNAAITVADSTNTLITSDELIVDSVETTIFELNKHYATANTVKVLVNSQGSAGHGKLIIDFALE